MSVTRLKYIKQFFPIDSYVYDTANSTYNITTTVDHKLFTGIPVFLSSDAYYTSYPGVATVTSANTFNMVWNGNIEKLSHCYVNGYLPGQTGQIGEPQTLPRATGTETIIQSYVNGTGGANYTIDVSLDRSHWIPSANVIHSTNNNDTTFVTISPGWAYYRANLNSVGANTNLVIISGE